MMWHLQTSSLLPWITFIDIPYISSLQLQIAKLVDTSSPDTTFTTSDYKHYRYDDDDDFESPFKIENYALTEFISDEPFWFDMKLNFDEFLSYHDEDQTFDFSFYMNIDSSNKINLDMPNNVITYDKYLDAIK